MMTTLRRGGIYAAVCGRLTLASSEAVGIEAEASSVRQEGGVCKAIRGSGGVSGTHER
jgi:hypothetical protein